MKFSHGEAHHFRYRGGKLSDFLWQPKSRKVYAAITFCIMTLSFVILFAITTPGIEATAPTRQVSTVSTKGKNGVSIPPGIATTNIAKATQDSINMKPKNTPKLIPPKPSWVSKPLYTDPTNTAAQYVADNPSAAGVGYIARMAQIPVAQWFGDWNTDVKSDADRYVSAAAATGSIPVLVAYNIPLRDCGGYSVGGADTVAVYTAWVRQLAAGIGNRPAVVILEPDALGALDCLPVSAQQDRNRSIAQAVPILKANPQTFVYIDAGTPVWQSATTMASRLRTANVAAADGFSLNVSYFASTAQNRAYGDQLSSLIGYKHYVIDTSRNGGNHAVTGMQCNPSFAALGETPTTNIDSHLNDALLWIKIPWESDGECNGSPGPGVPYWTYAVQLAQNAGW